MSWLTGLRARLRLLVGRRGAEARMEEEFRFHLEMETERRIRAGATPAEARRQALVAFGGVERYRESMRDGWGLRWLRELARDARFAARSLAKTPGFTTAAVLTLALGIGANTAAFSVLYRVLLRPLPYPAADRLVEVAGTYRGRSDALEVTYPEFRFLQQNVQGLVRLAARAPVGFDLYAGGEAERVHGLRVSSGYFRVLGVPPALGRGFTTAEDRLGGPRVAILSHELWERRFAGARDIVGRTILLDGEPYTVIGVMPAGFRSAGNVTVQGGGTVDVWSTVGQVSRTIGSGLNLDVLGRLRPGLSQVQVQAALAPAFDAYERQFSQLLPQRGTSVTLRPFGRLVGQPAQRPVTILFVASALLLLIACANVVGLMLGRALTRDGEIALRMALGASRRQLLQLLLVESVTLALIGGAAALLVAEWGVHTLLGLLPVELAGVASMEMSAGPLAFNFAVAIVAGLVLGLVPAWQMSGVQPRAQLQDAAARTTAGVHRARLRNALVIGELAISLVLLVGAGLLIRTLSNLLASDVGFDTHHVLTAEIWLTGTRYDSTSSIAGFYDALLARVDAIPGVRAAGVIEAGLPLQRGGNMPALVEGRMPYRIVDYRAVTPGYFKALGVPLIEGRSIGGEDQQGAQPVAVVNRAFARTFFPGADVIGHVVRVGGSSHPLRRIVGVLGNASAGADRAAPPTVFIPAAQTPAGLTLGFDGWFATHVVVRTAGDPVALAGALTRVIRGTDPQVPLGRVQSMDRVLSTSVAFQRFAALLLAVFAGLAVMLAAVGVFASVAWFATQRRHEMGVRIALGARPGDVVRMVVGRAMLVAGAGVGIGLGGALALSRVLRTQLYHVSPFDPLTFTLVAASLAAVVLLSSYLPARRAASADPVEALRAQ